LVRKDVERRNIEDMDYSYKEYNKSILPFPNLIAAPNDDEEKKKSPVIKTK
jgi:hypothetical protein